jgi:hypothetical protein
MPRPKPDKIIRHQIVFGEADRKILQSYNASSMLSNMTGNLVKLLNDVTGTATVLAILAATGILGAKFVFNVSSKAMADEAGDLIIEEFRNQYRDAVQRRVETRGIGSEVADERATSVVGGLQNLVEAALAPIFAITGGIDMPEIRRPGQ